MNARNILNSGGTEHTRIHNASGVENPANISQYSARTGNLSRSRQATPTRSINSSAQAKPGKLDL